MMVIKIISALFGLSFTINCSATILNIHGLFPYLFYHEPGRDQIELRLKSNHIILKIWDAEYPNNSECKSGYQIYPISTESLELLPLNNIVSFPIALKKECLESLCSFMKIPMRILEQEIDLHTLISKYKNGQNILTEFENGTLSFAIIAKADIGPRDIKTFERTYTLKDAQKGKILVRKNEDIFGDID